MSTHESNNNELWFKIQDKRRFQITLKTIREGRERITKGTKQKHGQGANTAVVDADLL